MADLKLALEEVKEESESGAAMPAAGRAKRGKGLWAAFILLVAVAGAAYWLLRGDRTPQAALQAVPLTTYRGYENSPSFSPDGNQVAFSWNGEKQDNYDIYVKLIGSGRPLQLTTDPAPDVAPAWSPDGASIAFVRFGRGKARICWFLHWEDPERELVEMLTGNRIGAPPSVNWSPDGRWLVVTETDSAEKPDAQWLVSVESGEKRRLTLPPASNSGDYSGAFSPDARTLVRPIHRQSGR